MITHTPLVASALQTRQNFNRYSEEEVVWLIGVPHHPMAHSSDICIQDTIYNHPKHNPQHNPQQHTHLLWPVHDNAIVRITGQR